MNCSGVNRSSLYYEPVEPDAEELELMRRMDELHLKHPFFGSRMMARTLKPTLLSGFFPGSGYRSP